MRTGQVIGSTDKQGAEPNARPVKFKEVFATLFNNMGIPSNKDRIFDLGGRPQYPVEPEVKPLRELI